MHACQIIQELLRNQCPSMHAKRRECLVRVTAAALESGLGLLKMSRGLGTQTDLRHRIKCCDRLLSNRRLQAERVLVYKALAERLLGTLRHVCIVVDWSALRADGSLQLLRAATVVSGRAITVYEEVHPLEQLGTAAVQREFMVSLRDILPRHCQPIIMTDAGFRGTWFKMLDQQGWHWIGRIRNRDLVTRPTDLAWIGCKTLYDKAQSRARDLGSFLYTRASAVPCRLVLIKHAPKGRHHKTKLGKRCLSSHSRKNRNSQVEPWLLAVSPSLATLNASDVVRFYAGRMQIEQTFRDLKSAQYGQGLETCQTRTALRIANLILIGTLLTYALWLIGISLHAIGWTVRYGSRSKAATTLSILSLANYWATQLNRPTITSRDIHEARLQLIALVVIVEI